MIELPSGRPAYSPDLTTDKGIEDAINILGHAMVRVLLRRDDACGLAKVVKIDPIEKTITLRVIE